MTAQPELTPAQPEEMLYRQVIEHGMFDGGTPMTQEEMDTLPMDEWWLVQPSVPTVAVVYKPVGSLADLNAARLAAEARAEALEKEVERLRERVTTLQNDHLRAIRAGRELRETDEHAGVMAVLAARTAHSVERDDALWVNPYEAQHLLAALAAGPDAGAQARAGEEGGQG